MVTDFFSDFARLGPGWVMYLLIFLSIVSIGVMIDRFMWFRARDTDTDVFTRELRGAVERDEVERLVTKYKDDTAVPIQVALRGLAERTRGPDAAAEAMHGEKSRWRRAADSNLIVLGTLGNNVPFIGLFGTVLGVVKAFDQFTPTGGADIAVIQELSRALVATAVGLFVAIPAVIAYNYFTRRLKVIMSSADECAHAVHGLVHGAAYLRRTQRRAAPASKKATTDGA